MRFRPTDTEKADRDLGFGSVSSRARMRLLNPDGSFNVERHGLGWRAELSLYHGLLSMSWPRFLLLLAGTYLLMNVIFASAYTACGPHALSGAEEAASFGVRWWMAFFFSVQTYSTVGYGGMVPVTFAANLVMTLQTIVGLLSIAVVTGMVFARFSRPRADIVFSRDAVIAPYRGFTAFMFRIANRRRSDLTNLEARVILSMTDPGQPGRRVFLPLQLERDAVGFFPLSWTVVHPIDDVSPLHGLDEAELARREAEFLVLLSGFEETFSQTVHTRSSYVASEVRWNCRFDSMYDAVDESAPVRVDVRRIHDVVAADGPTVAPAGLPGSA